MLAGVKGAFFFGKGSLATKNFCESRDWTDGTDENQTKCRKGPREDGVRNGFLVVRPLYEYYIERCRSTLYDTT